jgi:predicted CoA-binding protein
MTLQSDKTVVILGASNKGDRYSYKALMMLKEHGYHAVPVHPLLTTIENSSVVPSLSKAPASPFTLTLYVNGERVEQSIEEIVALHPQRVIFNPGTESVVAQKRLDEHHIPWIEACTLVLLRTGQFDSAGLSASPAGEH